MRAGGQLLLVDCGRGVLQRAAANGQNFVITHEPTFYVHQDTTAEIQNDPTLKYKLDFIRKNNIAIFRFHDRSGTG